MKSDPRWSAYVLSELEPAEAARVEEELQSSAEARETVADLRRTALLLEEALAKLPSIALTGDQRRSIEEAPRKQMAPRLPLLPVWASRLFSPRVQPIVFGASSLGILAVVLMMFVFFRSAPTAPSKRPEGQAPAAMQFEIFTPPTSEPASFAISPDGRMIVHSALLDGQSGLRLRSMDTAASRLVAGTDSAIYPFWSPDSRSIGFFADGKLKKVAVDGGPVLVLAEAPGPQGGSWGPDGTILFATLNAIYRTSSAGGAPLKVTRVQTSKEKRHGFPQFLPDGRHFVYYVQGLPQVQGVYVGQIGGEGTRHLRDSDSAAIWVPSGQLMFVKQKTLLAQNFDSASLTLKGNPYPVAEQVFVAPSMGIPAVSVSAKGAIAYRSTLGPQWDAGQLISISPDGRWIAYQSDESGRSDIYIRPLTGTAERWQVSPTGGTQPLWRADGRELFFTTLDGETMAAPLAPDPNGRDIQIGKASPLFQSARNLMDRAQERTRVVSPITVIVNWTPRP